MSLEFEAAKDLFEEKEAQKSIDGFEGLEADPEKPRLQFDFDFLLAKTGDGSIESYIDHPLNFSRSKGLAQIIRGATGLVGELDLAIVDIGLGAFNMMREGKANAPDIPR